MGLGGKRGPPAHRRKSAQQQAGGTGGTRVIRMHRATRQEG